MARDSLARSIQAGAESADSFTTPPCHTQLDKDDVAVNSEDSRES